MHQLSQAYRRVHAVIEGSIGLLADIRTADDLLFQVATWNNIHHTRDMLPEFTNLSAALDLHPTVNNLQTIRHLPESIPFSVTVNFVGRRNYNQQEIKAAVSEGILRRYPLWSYSNDDRDAHLNLRIFIEHDHATVGIRLAAAPLHRRPYKQNSLPGSLKSSVAAAMIQLANLQHGHTLLDPFCGSGTIIVEAAQQGLTTIGGDREWQSLEISQENIVNANIESRLMQWDAQHLPLNAHCVHAIVSNLPWGKQIKVDESLRTLYARAYKEMRRVIVPGGVMVLLTTLPHLIPHAPSHTFEISLYGQNPSVLIYQ